MNNPELHIFENHHDYDLMLPKPAHKGLTIIKPRAKFAADKSFQEYVKVGMLRYIGPHVRKEVIVESKLILDQPPVITNEGKVEHVTAGKKKLLTENEGEGTEPILLVESPASGIKIVND